MEIQFGVVSLEYRLRIDMKSQAHLVLETRYYSSFPAESLKGVHQCIAKAKLPIFSSVASRNVYDEKGIRKIQA